MLVILNVGANLFISSFNKISEYLRSMILRVRISAFSSVKLAISAIAGSSCSSGAAEAPAVPAALDACSSISAFFFFYVVIVGLQFPSLLFLLFF